MHMLILASKSPARNTLLAGAGLIFESCPARIDERTIETRVLGKGGTVIEVARTLAEAKALSVAKNRAADLVIGADQVLALGDEILHKPPDMAGAADELWKLRGRSHRLHSAVAVAQGDRLLWSAVDTATLTMRAFTPLERDRVLALEGEAVLGSVGAYRLEGPSVRLFERIEGDYFTVLGLPLLPLLAALRQHAPDLFE